jgi:hypothetical protein|tara:strand:+ start:557 stop:661 length:105 start_codon:yes stop_codon:yes gene_type:complete
MRAFLENDGTIMVGNGFERPILFETGFGIGRNFV